MLYGNISGYTYTPSETVSKISNKIIKDTGLGADKENTDINIDKDLDGAIGITPHRDDGENIEESHSTEESQGANEGSSEEHNGESDESHSEEEHIPEESVTEETNN